MELGDEAGASLRAFPAVLLHLGKVVVQDMAAGLAAKLPAHSVVKFLRSKPYFRWGRVKGGASIFARRRPSRVC